MEVHKYGSLILPQRAATQLENPRQQSDKEKSIPAMTMTNNRNRWTSEEEQALYAGVEKYGVGKWKEIIKDPQYSAMLVDRSNVDLKDKWRNLHAALYGSRSRGKVKTLTTGKTTNPHLTDPVPLAVIPPIEYGGGSRIEHGGSPHIEHGGSPHIEHGGSRHIEHGGSPHIEHGGSPHIEHGGGSRVEYGGGSRIIEYSGGPLKFGGSSRTEYGGIFLGHGGGFLTYGGSSHIEHGGSPHIEHGGRPHTEHGGTPHIEHGGRPQTEHGGSSANKKPPPTYKEMIVEAIETIEDLNENGLNVDAICYSIQRKYKLPKNFRRSVTSALRRLLLSGVLEKEGDIYKFKEHYYEENAEPVAAETEKDAEPVAAVTEKDAEPVAAETAEDAEPVAAETEEEKAVSDAALSVVEAETKILAAIKVCEKAEKLAELLEESEAMLKFAEEIYEQCERMGHVLFG